MTQNPATLGMGTQPKGLDLAVLGKGAKDYLDFLDESKELFYAYLYHRTGSEVAARNILTKVYTEMLGRALSLLWFGTLSFAALLDRADALLASETQTSADLDRVYLPKLVWLSGSDRAVVATLHDALWTLDAADQRILTLSLLVGCSDERMSEILSMKADAVGATVAAAKDRLLERWQPGGRIASKLHSLAFTPSLDLQSETKLRMDIVEKYNALRYRRYQWVILAGLFAVLSNVIVAGIIGFAVITVPSSNLLREKTQLASLDAILAQREYQLHDAKRAVADLAREPVRAAAVPLARDAATLGLSAAVQALREDSAEQKEVNTLLKMLRSAGTAMLGVKVALAR